MGVKFWNFRQHRIRDQSGGEYTERVLTLDGTIESERWFDDDITPQMFKDELGAGDGDVTVWINSPGGNCVAAAQIYNALVDYPGWVTVKIDGLCASAASVIAMAGDRILMSPVSILMIHNPSTMVIGDRDDLQEAIGMLDAVKDSIINAYVAKTKLSRAKLSKLMDSNKYMDATEAIRLGFCDGLIERAEHESAEDNLSFKAALVAAVRDIAESQGSEDAMEELLSGVKPMEDTTEQEEGTSAKELAARLDSMKHFI